MADGRPSSSSSFLSSWFRSVCCRVLQAGPMPSHIAIIMDGNRRFAKKSRQERSFGHVMGFEKLVETLEWCLDLGIKEVTVYAFSIYNFQRSKDEVDGLMELAKQKIARLLQEDELIERHGVCIRVLGDIKLLPRDVQESVAKAVTMTKNNNKVFLNVCFSYASRYEITDTIQSLVEGSHHGTLLPSDISEELLERCLYTGSSPPPDLVIRTSGEVRLSDFLIWQSSYSCLCFQDVLWPEFSVWNLFSSILTYQRNHNDIQAARDYMFSERKEKQYKSDRDCVLAQYNKREGGGEDAERLSETNLQELISEYAAERERRTEQFVQSLIKKRISYLDELTVQQ